LKKSNASRDPIFEHLLSQISESHKAQSSHWQQELAKFSFEEVAAGEAAGFGRNVSQKSLKGLLHLLGTVILQLRIARKLNQDLKSKTKELLKLQRRVVDLDV
jgi:hypothetical protein